MARPRGDDYEEDKAWLRSTVTEEEQRTRVGTSLDTSYTSRKLIHGELESKVWLRLREATRDKTHTSKSHKATKYWSEHHVSSRSHRCITSEH
ncbi:hypothetical protein Bca4012_051371 [Brassica carinata]|uniref:Uncharacterized protein n=1 Tax=Brassica carinata TaxID=52824 RepID=A0A8X7ULE7_BRACI|nr:hypothetical protein Bca52824_053969 [Brassica carinata]